MRIENREFLMEDEVYLIFLSHKAEIKGHVQKLKEGLEVYGVEAFVAHSDIDPGTEWQEEILEALRDMDAFVPILTEGFRDSQWTDQEVGYALARDVPIIPLRVNMDPYGFIGRYQGLTCAWREAPQNIIMALMSDPKMVDSFIQAVAECDSLVNANRLAKVLQGIEELTERQTSRLLTAFEENEQISKSYGFNGMHPSKYGDGLAVLLSGLTDKPFRIREDWQGRIHIEAPLPWVTRW